MTLINYLLYTATALIWGSTWLAIQFQLGTVSPLWSVSYRFAMAALILLVFCVITGRKLRFTAEQHGAMALQGLLLFSLNYVLYYIGSQYFISGLVSIIFASIIIMNIINGRIFFKTPLVARVIVGAMLGLLGLVIVFGSQFELLDWDQGGASLVWGAGICLSATLCASFGNMVSVRSQKLKLPVLQSNALGMAYGTVFVTLLAIGLGEQPTFDWSFKYVGSLFYLSFVGTVLAFGAYLNLLGRIGPERASYTFVLIPVVSLTLSTLFEGFQWTLSTVAGAVLVLIGNVLVLKKKPLKNEVNTVIPKEVRE